MRNRMFAAVVLMMLSMEAFGEDVASERARKLCAELTLDEKIGELVQTSSGVGSLGLASSESAQASVRPELIEQVRAGGCGTLIGVCGIANYNALQRVAMEERRVKIPLMVGHDMIHSCLTVLPVPIALSCAWDEDLWWKCGDLIARESPLKGCNWTFAPMVDIARDARWGRIAEGPGQDALLASRMCAAVVKGIQDPGHVAPMAACLKHYVGYGAAIAGRDYNDVDMSDNMLRNVYLPPFKAGIDAGAWTVMPAFHSFNGTPCSINKHLLGDLLREELGFRGLVVSDYNSIGECAWENRHCVSEDGPALAAKALDAGVTVDMMSGTYAKYLRQAVAQGLVDEKILDRRVCEVLRVKSLMGLFENPYIDKDQVAAACDSERDAQLAREIAARCCVLLKNEGNVLPLRKGLKVALVGPAADDCANFFGCWVAVQPQNVKNATIVDGLKADAVDFTYVKGYGFGNEPVDAPALERVASDADVILALFGEHGESSGENQSRQHLELGTSQLQALDMLKKTGKPIVALLGSGRPLVIPELKERADAILVMWSPGSSGGWGVADVLTGRRSPSGRLTVDFPAASGQCPVYYDRTRTGRPSDIPDQGERWVTRYIDGPEGGLYPFGYGLTYTHFTYSQEKVRVESDKLVCDVTVENDGSADGVETVQVYTRQVVAKISQPRRRLRGWKRVPLKSGEKASVRIEIPMADLDYWADGRQEKPSGRILVWIAADSNSGTPVEIDLSSVRTKGD